MIAVCTHLTAFVSHDSQLYKLAVLTSPCRTFFLLHLVRGLTVLVDERTVLVNMAVFAIQLILHLLGNWTVRYLRTT